VVGDWEDADVLKGVHRAAAPPHRDAHDGHGGQQPAVPRGFLQHPVAGGPERQQRLVLPLQEARGEDQPDQPAHADDVAHPQQRRVDRADANTS
jgi:hypothetical protein